MNRNAKETIKATLSIESVVGSYLKLEKAGKYFKARCPFHNEKSASFTVTPEKEIFYCYGCHKGGDIFSFVQEIEGISFREALVRLAEKAGISLDDDEADARDSVSVLRKIMEEAARFFEIGLRTHPPVVTYLQERGMTKETMVAFRIGYAPKGWSGLYDFLKRKKYTDEDIIACGLCISGKGRGLYDRFRERIMFPIMDSQGRVIAFTGRIIPGTEESLRPVGKYINSPETPLFHKSSVLFGFDKAKSAMHSEDKLIIVEGQMDCIMSHQAGYFNTVALSGTAATDDHMLMIKRFTDKIILCLDTDNAGLAAAFKTAMRAYRHDMRVAIVDLGSNKDPADMIRENPEDWKRALDHRKDIVTFRLEMMRQKKEFDRKQQIAEQELFPLLEHITSEIHLDEKLQEIAHAFGVSSVVPLRKDFERYRSSHTAGFQEKKTQEEGHVKKILPIKQQITFLKRALGEPSDHVLGTDVEYQLFMLDLEQVLGPLDQSRDAFIRFAHQLELRYELDQIMKTLEQLHSERVRDPHNSETLKKIHESLRRKDELINRLSN